MSKPPADIEVSIGLVRDLLRTQHPDLSALPIIEASAGWDNAMFRLGEDLAARFPRRAVAVTPLENEQRWLPVLHGKLPLPVPNPIRVGHAQGAYPWRWSITPWIAGDTADRSALDPDQACVFAAFLEALHTSPPNEAPRNPYRGVPLIQRHAKFVSCVTALAERGEAVHDKLLRLWSDAVQRPIDVPPSWIHGDLHSQNVLVSNGRLAGVIDWGDVAQGDRATDLAAVWMIFVERESRDKVVAACKSVSPDTWQRARGWALLLSIIILAAGDPGHAVGAQGTLRRLLDGP